MSGRPFSSPPTIEGLRFLRNLGQGGSADVFLYEQWGRKVAVKVVTGRLDAETRAAFAGEAHRMSQLSHHPAIVTIFDVGFTHDGRPCLVMEYCPPPTLAERVRDQPWGVAETLRLGVRLCEGVEAAHSRGVIHRDIKPANILFTEFGHPALTDFGVSSRIGNPDGVRGVTVPWAPPEQLDGAGGDVTTDVYSLGATLWAMLTGRPPFQSDTEPNDTSSLAQRVRERPVGATGRDDAPPELEALLERTLAKDPRERPADVAALAAELSGILTALEPPTAPAQPADPRRGLAASGARQSEPSTAAPPRRWWVGAVTAALVATIALVVALVVIGDPSAAPDPVPVLPQDPVAKGAQPVPGGTATREGARVRVTWSVPADADVSSQYGYTVVDPATPGPTRFTRETSVTLRAGAGAVCVDLIHVTSGGRSSVPLRVCEGE